LILIFKKLEWGKGRERVRIARDLELLGNSIEHLKKYDEKLDWIS
jgi:hypothetical protein